MNSYIKIPSENHPNVILRAFPGHFVTPNSHCNYYLDIVPMQSRISEARSVARALSSVHYISTPVDTIICMPGMEVIGAYFAEELTAAGVISMNMHNTIYVLKPEYNQEGQMIFRKSVEGWIRKKNVFLLVGLSSTGETMARAINSLIYYGAKVSGAAAIFSTVTKVAGMPISYLFSTKDIPDYHVYESKNCPMCRDHIKVDALCNANGFTPL